MRWFVLFFPAVLCAQFEYDRTQPFDNRPEPLAERPAARVWGSSFLGPQGGRVNFVLVEPKRRGRAARSKHPAVLFQHGGGQSMSNYISEALVLADLGVTSMIIDAPARVEGRSFAPPAEIVVSVRRALDLLLSQPGVDPGRIGYVGHSYGGMTGGVLAGVEARVRTFILIGALPRWLPPVAEADPERFLPQANRPVLVQCARFDTPENVKGCPEVHRLAGGPKRLTWYDDDHNFTSLEALRDRLYWLQTNLKLRGVENALRRWTAPVR